MQPFQWRMQRLGVQILSISCSFGEILVKSYVGVPWRVGAPTLGKSWIRHCLFVITVWYRVGSLWGDLWMAERWQAPWLADPGLLIMILHSLTFSNYLKPSGNFSHFINDILLGHQFYESTPVKISGISDIKRGIRVECKNTWLPLVWVPLLSGSVGMVTHLIFNRLSESWQGWPQWVITPQWGMVVMLIEESNV